MIALDVALNGVVLLAFILARRFFEFARVPARQLRATELRARNRISVGEHQRGANEIAVFCNVLTNRTNGEISRVARRDEVRFLRMIALVTGIM